MADPNRKINLDLPSDDEEESDQDPEFEPEEVSLVKEFEEEFKHRFTDKDEYFVNFCKQEVKPPPIVFPYEKYNHQRGGGGNRHHGGGGRPYSSNQRFDNHHHYNNRGGGNRGGNRFNNRNDRYTGNNFRQNQNPHHDSQQAQTHDYKRKRFNE